MHFEQADIAATLRRLALAAITACLIAMSHATAGNAEDRDPIGSTEISREHLIQAMILYNFAKFTEWPADAFKDFEAHCNFTAATFQMLADALGNLYKENEIVVLNEKGGKKRKGSKIKATDRLVPFSQLVLDFSV